jgi:hypothetical protein
VKEQKGFTKWLQNATLSIIPPYVFLHGMGTAKWYYYTHSNRLVP